MITKISPAKVNLTLDVRPKIVVANFHELETIYHRLNWGDEITIKAADKFEIIGNFDCNLEHNLIYKAWELVDSPKPVKVTVNKQIPTGGGLGGGSSNAATFVLAYFELFNLGPVPNELITKLGDLGKDIPFFLNQTPCALGTHYGEIIKPLDFNFSGQSVYLYFPSFKSNTAKAYAGLKDFNTHYTSQFLANPKLENCGNSFEQIIEQKKYSKIHLSGSGSTFFSFKKLNTPKWKMIQTQFY